MTLTNTARRYGLVPQLLHWIVLALIVAQYLLAESAEAMKLEADEAAMMGWHMSVGLTVLLLAFVRVAWRLLDRPPPPLPMPAWQRRAASLVHWALYVLLFAMPLTGWITASAEGATISWFGLADLPQLAMPSESIEDVFHEAHELLFNVLLGLVALHILAALKHQFIDRDGLLWRMLPWGGND